MDRDCYFMDQALAQARSAQLVDEVPVGAVVVHDGRIVGTGSNAKESTLDPTAHAEIVALRQAATRLGRWRLIGCCLYVTLEPCAMCVGAMIQARIDRLVFGCADPKAGAVSSVFQIANDVRLNHQIEVRQGLRANESANLLRSFFKRKRSLK